MERVGATKTPWCKVNHKPHKNKWLTTKFRLKLQHLVFKYGVWNKWRHHKIEKRKETMSSKYDVVLICLTPCSPCWPSRRVQIMQLPCLIWFGARKLCFSCQMLLPNEEWINVKFSTHVKLVSKYKFSCYKSQRILSCCLTGSPTLAIKSTNLL